jgi:hypothetical protein
MIELSAFFQACDCFGAINTRVTVLSFHDPSPSRFDMPREAAPRIRCVALQESLSALKSHLFPR